MATPLRRQEAPTARRSTTSAVRSRRRSTTHRPRLALAQQTRRWPAAFAGVTMIFVLALMLGAAVFHTQLAERQLAITELERAVDDERERFDELRRRRAELRSPSRLASEAEALGMVRADTGQFVDIDPWMLARQLAAAGVIDDVQPVIDESDPLAQFSDVKRVSAGQP